MNKLVVNNQAKLIPAKWQECPDRQKVAILEMLDLKLPRAITYLRVLWILLNWQQDRWYWLKATAIRFKMRPQPKTGSDFWWKWQYLSRMTDAQRSEWLECVKWIETPLAFEEDKPNMFKAPFLPIKWEHNLLDLPLAGLNALKWAQFVECDLHLRAYQAGDESALDDFISNLYLFPDFEYDKNKVHLILEPVRKMRKMEKILILNWYLACLKYMESCHPRVFKKAEESDDAPDPYGLVGLTHRMATSVSDVADVENMDTWTLLANFEIKLADEEKRPKTTPA
jgi:hypothetical protein